MGRPRLSTGAPPLTDGARCCLAGHERAPLVTGNRNHLRQNGPHLRDEHAVEGELFTGPPMVVASVAEGTVSSHISLPTEVRPSGTSSLRLA